MGVAGLWDVIRPAGEQRSLTHLSVVDGFQTNPSGKRGYRIGIDASIWFFHAAYGREGENPEIRTMFFRCARLMSMPFLPLFVFDGPKRPNVKRGKRIGKNAHWMTDGMKNLIKAFGFEWHTAPGEAEAELAYFNRIGLIDAVLSDDVDNFLFGAQVVVRNPSATLSGNRGHPTKNAAGKDDGNHVMIYRASQVRHHPNIGLTQGGLILIGLLGGGDYQEGGLQGCGPKIARGLALAGLGDSLLDATQRLSRDELPDFLDKWREQLRYELRTDASKHIGKKNVALSKNVPEDFPDIDVLLSYTNPITSESERGSAPTKITWNQEPDIGKIASLCELYFEWGVKDIIIKRFRTVLWPSMSLRILRKAALDLDRQSSKSKVGAPPVAANMFMSRSAVVATASMCDSDEDVASQADDDLSVFVKIHSSRQHASTDALLEYRLEIAPALLVQRAGSGVKGIRPPIESDPAYDDEIAGDDDDDGETTGRKRGNKSPPDPQSHFRVWLPACMVERAIPALVEEFKSKESGKAAKKTAKKAAPVRKAKKGTPLPWDEEEEDIHLSSQPSQSSQSSQSSQPPPSQSQKHATKTSQAVGKTSRRTQVAALFADTPFASQSSTNPALHQEEESDVYGISKPSQTSHRRPGVRKHTAVTSSSSKFQTPPLPEDDEAVSDASAQIKTRPFPLLGVLSPLGPESTSADPTESIDSPHTTMQRPPAHPLPIEVMEISDDSDSDGGDGTLRQGVRSAPTIPHARSRATPEPVRKGASQPTLARFMATSRPSSQRAWSIPASPPGMDTAEGNFSSGNRVGAVAPSPMRDLTPPTAHILLSSSYEEEWTVARSAPQLPRRENAHRVAPRRRMPPAPSEDALSAISVSSDEEEPELPPLMLAKQRALARATSIAPPSRDKSSVPKTTLARFAQTTRAKATAASRRNDDDVIDLT